MTHISPAKIGLIGDVHGNIATARTAVKILGAEGITEIHFLGDFGFAWRGDPKERRIIAILNDVLERVGAVAYVTLGNHENYDLILAIEPDENGIRWLSDRIGLLPRGWRATTAAGRTLTSFGGANSIDRERRQPKVSWWAQEQITDADLEALGTERVDVLLGHDSPMVTSLAGRLQLNEKMWTRTGLAYADQGQKMFHRGFLAVKPSLTLGGHYHLSNDQTDVFVGSDGEEFVCRCVVLDADGEADSVAILDTAGLSLRYLNDTLRKSYIRDGWEPTD